MNPVIPTALLAAGALVYVVAVYLGLRAACREGFRRGFDRCKAEVLRYLDECGR